MQGQTEVCMAGIKRGKTQVLDTASKSGEILAVKFKHLRTQKIGELAFVGLRKHLKIPFLVLDG